MTNTKTANKARELCFTKDISNHAIAFALEKTTLGSRSDNARRILVKEEGKDGQSRKWRACPLT
jgi:hypothetical protein